MRLLPLSSPWLILLGLALLSALVSASTDFYKRLKVDRQADERTIKKAYRRLAKEHHPDKNPDPASHKIFEEASHAYEVLMDEGKRRIYDRHGEEGLKQHAQQQGGGGGFHHGRDVFSQMFHGQQEEQRGPGKLTEIEVDLADFYRGRDIEFEMDRNILCDHCRGSGAASDGDIVKCTGCGGQGVKLQRAQIFPGMFTQMQSQCNECGGKGTQIRKPCPHCKGQKIISTRLKLSLHLPAGAPEQHEVVFDGEADESPDYEAGDVVVRTRSRSQLGKGGFTRKEGALIWREVLSVEEALLGFNRTIRHMDGHEVDLSRSGVTQPEYIQVIKGEGMPAYGERPTGDLFVHYTVLLPSHLSPSLRKDLGDAFIKGRGGKPRDEL